MASQDIPGTESAKKMQQDTSAGTSTHSNPETGRPGDYVSPSDPANSPARTIHGVRWVLVVISVLSSIFLYSLDNTVVADITPAAVNQFGDVLKLPWLSVGFLLGGATVVLSFGKLYGLLDAKWLYILSLILFNVGSALCGAAPNMNALIVGRVLAGMGGNGMYLGVMTLLSVNTSDRERPRYLSFVGLVWGIGTVLGPVIGGAFTESRATWRWAFYINLCVAGLFAPVYLFWIPAFKPHANTSPAKLLRQFDIAGTALSAGAITCLVMAINFGGALYAWNSGRIIALFVVSFVLFAVFSVQQTLPVLTTPADRVFPVHFLRDWNAVLLFACAAAVNTSAFVVIYYIPIYFQFSRGDGPIAAAVRLLPLICVLSATILANGHFMARFGYFQPWYTFGSTLTLVGAIFLSRIQPNSSEALIYGLQVLVGIGTGSFIQAGYAVIQTVVPPTEMAYAISFMMLAQIGGIAFGLAIAGAVFVNAAIRGLTVILPGVSYEELQLAISGTSNDYFQSLDLTMRAEVTDAIVGALQKVFIPVYVGAAVSLVLSVCFTKRRMFKDTMAIAA